MVTPANDATDVNGSVEVDYTKLTVKELVEMGVDIREAYRDETRRYNKYKAEVDDMLKRIGMALKLKGDELGVDSFKTDAGTAYRNLKESYRVGDWDKVLAFIKENEAWNMLEKRVAKLATKERHKDLGEVPPGVAYIAEEVFVVRRPNETKDTSDE